MTFRRNFWDTLRKMFLFHCGRRVSQTNIRPFRMGESLTAKRNFPTWWRCRKYLLRFMRSLREDLWHGSLFIQLAERARETIECFTSFQSLIVPSRTNKAKYTILTLKSACLLVWLHSPFPAEMCRSSKKSDSDVTVRKKNLPTSIEKMEIFPFVCRYLILWFLLVPPCVLSLILNDP